MSAGISTPNLPASSVPTEVLCNAVIGGRTVTARVPIGVFSNVATAASIAVFATTKAALDGMLGYPAGAGAYVLSDSDEAKRGVYIKSGASGSGSWGAKVADLLVGPAGAPAEMRIASGFLQYRAVGATSWINLTAVSAITGPKGADGKDADLGPVTTALDNESKARAAAIADVLDRIGRINAGLYPSERPGDNPTAFTASRAGGDPAALAPLDTSLYPIRSVADGLGVEVSGSREVWERTLHAIEPGRLWRGRWRYVRTANAQDPENDSVQALIQWYDRARAVLGGPVQVEAFTPSVGGGPHERLDFIGPTGVTGVIPNPAAAVYFRLGFKAFGNEARTVLTDLQAADVSDIDDAIRRLVPDDALPSLSARLDELSEDLAQEVTRALAVDGDLDLRTDNLERSVKVRDFGEGAAITDEAGNALLRVAGSEFKTAALVARRRADGDGLAITDEAGNILFRVTLDDIRHPAITRMRADIRASALSSGSVDRPAVICLAEALQILFYGQSLSMGWNATPALSTALLAYADRFSGGVRSKDGGSDVAANHGSLIGLCEQTVSNLGETPAYGCAMMIAQLLKEENGVDIATSGQRLLISAPGEGGQSAAALASGGLIQRVYDDIDYGRSLSVAAGRTAAVAGLPWVHGEEDYNAGTDPEAYKATVRNLRSLVETRANAAGGTRTLPMFITQCATHLFYNRTTPSIALAQLALCDDSPFIFVGPMSPMLFGPDKLHLTNLGSKLVGAYIGLAIKRAVIDGRKQLPLVPTAVERSGKSVLLHFGSAIGGLVLDTTTLPNPGNYGFTLADSAGNALPVASVSRVGVNSIIVRSSGAVPANARVRAGWIGDGARGICNLRDRQGESIVFDPGGLNRPLHRFAPIFERIVP